MSQRETLAKPYGILSLGGVNERLVATELPLSDFSYLEGTYPERTGQHTRMPGKRLLAKYADPIKGLAQFWTPLGYAQGLYQFDSKLSAGPWLTPTSNIVIPALPSALPFDGGNMSYDDFGNPYGGPLGEPNVCVIGFVGENSAHRQCGIEPSNIGTPDDTNGGSAGQGTHCRWELTPVVISYTKSNFLIGTDGHDDSGTEGPTPFPKPLTVMYSKPGTYTPGQGTYNANLVAYGDASSSKINIGFGNYVWGEGWHSYNQKATLNLSNLIIDGEVPVLVSMTIARNANAPFVFFEIILPISFGLGGNYTAFEFDPWNYLNTSPVEVGPVNGGFTRSDFINAGAITAYFNRRVCT